METHDVGAELNRALPRRINVRGTSGVGKTTFSRELARRLDLPWIELDGLHHGPNWSAPGAEEFRSRVREAMDNAPSGWVIDGNYDGKLANTVIAGADVIVWMDFPLRIVMPRLWHRTMHRIHNDVELWNGNRETWRDQFASRNSILLWTIRTHRKQRDTWPSRFGNDPRLVRLRSDAEVHHWLNELISKTGVDA